MGIWTCAGAGYDFVLLYGTGYNAILFYGGAVSVRVRPFPVRSPSSQSRAKYVAAIALSSSPPSVRPYLIYSVELTLPPP